MIMTMEDIRQRDFVEAPPLTEMQAALWKAGIRPLYDDDVKEYQEQKLRDMPPSPPETPPAKWRRYSAGYCQYGQLHMCTLVTAPGIREPIAIPPALVEACRRLAETGVFAGIDVEQLDRDPFLRVYSPNLSEIDHAAEVVFMFRETGPVAVLLRPYEQFYIGVWDEQGYCGG